MSEETKNADVSAPWGIVVALGTSAVVGWGYLMALLYSIQVRKLNIRAAILSCSAGMWCGGHMQTARHSRGMQLEMYMSAKV